MNLASSTCSRDFPTEVKGKNTLRVLPFISVVNVFSSDSVAKSHQCLLRVGEKTNIPFLIYFLFASSVLLF